MRVFLILCDLPTNYASGTTAFFAVFGIDHFWVGYESIHRVNLVGKMFQLSKPLSLVHAESFGGSLPFPLDIFFSHVRLWRGWYYPSRMRETVAAKPYAPRQHGTKWSRAHRNVAPSVALLLTQHLSVLSNHAEKLLYEWKPRSFDAESRPCGQRWTWNRDNTRRAR